MVGANVLRAVLTAVVAVAVFARLDVLPAPDEVDQVVSTEWLLYVILIVATLLLGVGEVLYDNSAQTFLPAIVEPSELERANGRLYSAELVANQFAGPPLASLLLAVSFALPFVARRRLVRRLRRAGVQHRRHAASESRTAEQARRPWREEAAEGFRWLWHHELLRPMAITLGMLNLLGTMSMALIVLWGQEVLGTSTTEFAILMTAAAFGGVLGGWVASPVARRIGSGPSLGADAVGWRALHDRHRTGLVLADRLGAHVRDDVRRRALERDHGEPAPDDHPRPPARPGQQRVPLLRVGGDLRSAASSAASWSPRSTDRCRVRPRCAPAWIVPGVAQLVVAVVAMPRLTTAKMDAARAAAARTEPAPAP